MSLQNLYVSITKPLNFSVVKGRGSCIPFMWSVYPAAGYCHDTWNYIMHRVQSTTDRRLILKDAQCSNQKVTIRVGLDTCFMAYTIAHVHT